MGVIVQGLKLRPSQAHFPASNSKDPHQKNNNIALSVEAAYSDPYSWWQPLVEVVIIMAAKEEVRQVGLKSTYSVI